MKRTVIQICLLTIALSVLFALATQSVAQDEKYPLAVLVSFEDGRPMPKVEDKLAKAIIKLGYKITPDAFIVMEGLLSISDEKQVSGLGTKTLVNLELDVQFRDAEQGDIIGNFSTTGRGMSDTREKAVQKGVQQIKIKTSELSAALEDCYDDYLRIKERRYSLSKQRFENAEGLYKKEEYRRAIRELKGV